jgi:glycerate 2-kinase
MGLRCNTLINLSPRTILHRLFDVAVAAAQPTQALAAALPPPPKGRTLVVGAGKAAAEMAAALEDVWPGSLSGLVITRYGHGAATRQIEVLEAAHPVPDAAGQNATQRLLDCVATAGPDDLILALISGGGSALLALPPPGVPLADVQALYRALLASGADIAQMNRVRKHVSGVLGGRLAVAAPHTPMVSLLISDVPGDDPGVIASGPTVPDRSDRAEAQAILAAYGIDPGPALRAWLASPAADTPAPDHSAFANKRVQVIASPQQSLRAAAAHAEALGFSVLVLGDSIEGEAREVAKVHAGIARSIRQHGAPVKPPCVLLSGGETTVTLRAKGGRGGRNAEFTLGLAQALNGLDGVYALAADTDGIDGTEDNAGAFVTPDTLIRAKRLAISAPEYLARNDSYRFFQALDDLLITGPTRTNVNDFRVLLLL